MLITHGALAARGRLDLARFDRSLVAIREGDLKLVSRSDGTEALYDLAMDPGETVDLSGERPDQAARLRSLGEASTTAVHGAGSSAVSDAGGMDDATRDRLRELGYSL